jgi:hypothetical protein
MTEGAPLPLILNFTFPLLLGNILQQTYSLVDAAIVGKFLGINDLAAIGASTSVVFLILGFCNGCCCGFGIPVAQKFGARDYKTVRDGQFTIGSPNVDRHCGSDKRILCRYPEKYADSEKYFSRSLLLSARNVYRSTLYVLLQLAVQHHTCTRR